ncbi:hypothetical protein GGI05_004422, partial [Coemansia sp. RSA 2603]
DGTAEVTKWQTKEKSSGVYGSNKGVFYPKEHGLVKRTISLAVPDDEEGYLEHVGANGNGLGNTKMPRVHQQHLVAYYHVETSFQMLTPDDIEELRLLRLPLPLLGIQRFRRPVKIEVSEDNQYDIHNSDAEEDMDESGRRVYKPGILAMPGLPASAPPSSQADLFRSIIEPSMTSLPFEFPLSSASSVPPQAIPLESPPHDLPFASSAQSYSSTVYPSGIDNTLYHVVTPPNIHTRVAVQPMPLHEPSAINPNIINTNPMMGSTSAYGSEIANFHGSAYIDAEGSGNHTGRSQRQPLDQNYAFDQHSSATLGSHNSNVMYSAHTALHLNHPQQSSSLMMMSADPAQLGHDPSAMQTQMPVQFSDYVDELYKPLQNAGSGNFDPRQYHSSTSEQQHSQSASEHLDRK